MKLTIAKCPSCGASIELDNNKNITKCKFCHNTIVIEDAPILFNDENEIEAHKLFDNKDFAKALSLYNEILKEDSKNPVIIYRAAMCDYFSNSDEKFNHYKLISKINVALHIVNESSSDLEIEEFKAIICVDIAQHIDSLLEKTKKDYKNSEKTKDDYNFYQSRIISLREIITFCITELFNDMMFQLAPYVYEDISTVELYVLFLIKKVNYNVELCKIIEYKIEKKGKIILDKATIQDDIRKALIEEYDMYVEEIKKYSNSFEAPPIERKGIRKGVFKQET